MSRFLVTAVAGTAALLLWTGAVSGSSTRTRGGAVKEHVTIKERLSSKTQSGNFSLELNGLVKDSGTSRVSPNLGAPRIVGGQLQYPLTGTDTLKTAKGTLSLSFVGISIHVNGRFFNEYGSWHAQGGSGIYQGWKGAGRWADVGTPTADNIEWDGFVTHP